MQPAAGEITERDEITKRESIARGLAKVFADTHALQAKTRRFQRDIRGPLSIMLRPVLQRQGNELGLATDRIAERMRSLSLAVHCPHPGPSKPGVHQGPVWTGKEMIDCLVGRHELLVHRTERVLRSAEKAMDLPTCDLLRQRISVHEQAAWVLVGVGFADLLREQVDQRSMVARAKDRAEPGLAAPPTAQSALWQKLRRRSSTPRGEDGGIEREGELMARTLVVYYSRTGTTRKAAAAIAEALGADVEELSDRKGRAGVLGYARNIVGAALGRETELAPPMHLPENYDLVVFGSPVWAGSLSTPVRTYLVRNYADLEEVAFFCTCGSNGGERVLRQMADLCRNEPVATMILRQIEILRGSFHRKADRFTGEITKALEEMNRPSPNPSWEEGAAAAYR